MDVLRGSQGNVQEYLLQGSILETNREMLLHRLNGLCDMVDTGPEKFHDHEMVFVLSKKRLCLLSIFYAIVTNLCAFRGRRVMA